MKLSGQERKKLMDAILDAYRDKGQLKMMVRIKLNENLDGITGEGNLTQVVFNLIEWAESRGELKLLVEGACEDNLGNQELQNIRKELFPARFSDYITIDKNYNPSVTKEDKAHSSQQKLKVFLCHASVDKPTVEKLYYQLLHDNFQPWLDKKDIKAGKKWEPEIMMAIQSSDIFVACLSKSLVDEISYGNKEIKLAVDVANKHPEGSTYIIPFKLEECNVPTNLEKYQWIDWFKDPQEGYIRLSEVLKDKEQELGLNRNNQ